jgi:hypothetical protein
LRKLAPVSSSSRADLREFQRGFSGHLHGTTGIEVIEREDEMRTTTITVKTVAILLGAAIALAAPAAAQNGPGGAPDQAGSPAERADGDQIVLRRDGDRAVPFDPVIGNGGELVLRRDGSNAVPFVAEVGPQTDPASSGFDWSNAMLVGGSALGLMLLGAGTLLLVLRRGRSGVRPGIPHSGTH